MSSRRACVTFVVALSMLSTAVVGAQGTRSNAPAAPKLRERMTPERMAATDSMLTHLGRALSVPSVGFAHRDTIVELRLENWKRGLAVDTLAPVARQGLALMLREDPTARRAKILSARFSDYAPQVVTLTWTAADFKAHPDRFRVTRQ